MIYFDGIHVGSIDHVPSCHAWVDRDFPDNCALNFARAGRIRHGVDGSAPVVLTGPVAWWTFPGPRFTYGVAPDQSWDHYYVTFHGPRVDRMLAEGLIPRSGPLWLSIHHAERMQSVFDSLIDALRERPAGNPRAVLLLEDLLLQLHEQALPEERQSRLECDIRALMQRFRDDPASRCDLKQEAKRIGVSDVHLRRAFRLIAGLPPGQFRIHIALDHAATLLRTTRLPIKEIAGRIGYDDVYHFTKLFKQRFRIPPGAYRAEMQPRSR